MKRSAKSGIRAGQLAVGVLFGAALSLGTLALIPSGDDPGGARGRGAATDDAIFFVGTASAPEHESRLELFASAEELAEVERRLGESLGLARAATVAVTGDGDHALAMGSGVVVSGDGIVLTAGHVISRPSAPVTVTFEDGRTVRGVTLGSSTESDAGMVRLLESGPYEFVELADLEDEPVSGEWCYALGHAGGVDLDRGAVLRLGRILSIDPPFTLQSSCKLLGGDSGGPLFNLDGKLIGIHSRIRTERLEENFHVRASSYLCRWEALRAGRVLGSDRGWLGIGMSRSSAGISVARIYADSAAEAAQLHVGDILTHINGESVLRFEIDDLQHLLRDFPPNEILSLGLRRGEAALEVDVSLRADPPPAD